MGNFLGFGLIIFWIVGIAGWLSNIVQLVQYNWDSTITVLFVLKCVGVFLAPLGSILGVMGWF